LEHKHFEFGTQKKTVITREYPHEFSKDNEPYYPINDQENNTLFLKYKALADSPEYKAKYLLGGRLADYKYYDMDDTVEAALTLCKMELKLP